MSRIRTCGARYPGSAPFQGAALNLSATITSQRNAEEAIGVEPIEDFSPPVFETGCLASSYASVSEDRVGFEPTGALSGP